MRAAPVPARAARRRARRAPALGVSFAHDPFRFLRADWWLLVVVLVLIAAYALQLLLGLSALPEPDAERARPTPLAAALGGLAYGAGAVLFAGTLAAHGDAWWPGLLGGLAAVALAQRAVLPVFARARARLADGGARQALSVYLDAASLLLAALVALLHPLGYVLLALLVVVRAARARARRGEVRRPAHPAPLMARRRPFQRRRSSSSA